MSRNCPESTDPLNRNWKRKALQHRKKRETLSEAA